MKRFGFGVWEWTATAVLTGVLVGVVLVRPGAWGDPGAVLEGPFARGLVPFLVLMIPAAVVLTAMHEAAHAVVGHVAGWKVFGVTLGHGRRLARFDVGSIRLEFRGGLVGGATFANATGRRWPDAAMLGAGVAVEAVVIAVALPWQPDALWAQAGKWAIILVACLDIAVNLWPRRVDIGPMSGLASDGAQILMIFSSPEQWRRDVEARRFNAPQARALQSLQGGDVDEAIQLAAAQADDTDRVSATLLGTLLLVAGRYREAYDKLRRWADEPDVDDLTANNAAWAAVMSFDPETLADADRWSARAHAGRPDDPACASTRGSTLVSIGRATEGRPLLEQAAAGPISRQQKALVTAFTALADHRLGRPEDAQLHLATSRSLDADCDALTGIEALMLRPPGGGSAAPWPAPPADARRG